MKDCLLYGLIISVLFLASPITHGVETERGVGGIVSVLITDKQDNHVGLYKESYALVIGASNYTNGWPKLSGVKKDVQLIDIILKQHGFKVVTVKDPGQEQLNRAFSEFINKYGRKPESRLLFYFAGHGYTLKQSYGEEMGYVIPVDAPAPEKNINGFMDKAMDMQQIEVFAKRIQSKHAIFIFDSCFSGSLFALSRTIPKSITYKTSMPVRQFITSGSSKEKVSDKSIFREQFVSALEGEGDMDNDGYVTGTELGEFLLSTVVNYTKGAQHPQYGKIRNPYLDKGDFVFALSSNMLKHHNSGISMPPDIDKDNDCFEEIMNDRKKKMGKWSNWQGNMFSRYSRNHDMEEGKVLKPTEKIQMWDKFLAEYSTDNPYSSKDQLLRKKAKDRLEYWRNYREPEPSIENQPSITN